MKNFGVKSLSVLVVVCLWLGSGVESTFAPPRRPGQSGYPIPFPQPKPVTRPLLIARYRRSPQGSVQGTISGQQGSRPSLNLDYKHNIIDNGRTRLDAYGGVSSPDFKHFRPRAGANYEYTPNKNFFVRGQGGVQQLPGGRFDPQVGVGLGWRF